MTLKTNLPYDRAKDGRRISVQQAATLLGCSRSWVYTLIADGHLKAYRIGTRKGLQITLKSAQAYIASRAELPEENHV